MGRTTAGTVALVVAFGIAGAARPARAHVDYVTEGPTEPVDALRFLAGVVSEPVNAALLAAGGVAAVAAVAGYLLARPAARDVEVLCETLAGYRDLVPWMLRLSLGLPVLGAGFAGYFFSPAVTVPSARVPLVAIGFALLIGLATRAVALAGLGLYLAGLVVHPELLLAMEYVPGFLAVALTGGGRPSADEMLARLARADGTLYGRIDPVGGLATRVNAAVVPARRYVPTLLRVGLGVTFVFLGVAEKLLRPGAPLAVVEKYGLTALVPVDPGLWVVGAALTEVGVGLALIAGLLTRGTAAVAFLVFTLTLFGLPDDPVLAHVTYFGLTSAVFTLGSGPLAIDEHLRARSATPG